MVARAILGNPSGSVRAGAISLRRHQLTAVSQLRAAIEKWRGALFADEAGLGKTYVALAVARPTDRVQIVAPAGLRSMWLAALQATERRGNVISFEALSRGASPSDHFDLLVVDEAHHARNPRTRRYATLAQMASRAPVLLLSATPIHNSARELEAILALFMGARAAMLSDANRAQCIVRRARSDVKGIDELPAVRVPRVIEVANEESILDALLAVPAPVTVADGGDGGALIAFSLVRQWASSRAALYGALRRRLVRSAVVAAALDAGRDPTRAELAAWMCGDDAVQLELPGLVPQAVSAPADLRSALAAHDSAISMCLARLAATTNPDIARADALVAIARSASDGRVVCFSQFAETVSAMYRLIRHRVAACALTSRGARVVGGRLSRRDAIRRFAPAANAAPAPAAASRIDVLLTTDLLSEGVNLQDAAVLVHLDLPWTPARLDQRLGRVARLGSPHAHVSVFALAPPAPAEALLRGENRLRLKASAAARLVGAVGAIIPSLIPPLVTPTQSPTRASGGSASELWQRARATAERWDDATLATATASPATVILRTRPAGVIVAVSCGGSLHALATVGGSLTDDPLVVAQALDAADAAESESEASREAVTRVELLFARWTATRLADEAIGLALAPSHHTCRLALRRIATILARVPRHRLGVMAGLAAQARATVVAPRGVGAERMLAQLVAAPLPDETWLRTLCDFGSAHTPCPSPESAPLVPRVVAALILEP
ncbi:MAG: hypothetical protein NVS1B4_03050 [Gemmatimonadaceae bacterium]